MLLEGRLEVRGPGHHPRQRGVRDASGQGLAVDPRRAEQLERPRGAPALRQVGALEQHRARVDHGALQGRQVGRGHDPRQPGGVVVRRPLPAVQTRHLQLGAEAEMVVEQARQLADRQAVAQRDRELPDERLVARLEQGALDLHAADGVGPVAHHHGQVVACGRAQAVGHRVDVGVDARAHVLQVDDEDVEAVEHGRGRLAEVAVQGMDGDVVGRMPRVRRLDHVVLDVRAEAVLGAEQGGQREVGRLPQPLRGVPVRRVDRGGVADEPDAAPREVSGRQQPVDTRRCLGRAAHAVECTGSAREASDGEGRLERPRLRGLRGG